MRRISVLTAALILFMSGSSLAQEWIQYASKADLFGVNFPSEPNVQDITYATEFGIILPGHLYSVEDGPSRYSVTVVNHLLRDGSNGCLLGFVTPMHGDPARGHGIEKDWDGDGGAGYSAAVPVATPR